MKYLLYLPVFFFLFSCDDDTTEPPATLPEVSINSLEIDEGNETRTILLDVRLSAPAAEQVSVLAQSIDSTALAGEDYTEVVFEPVVFAPGDLRVTLEVEVLGDRDFEQAEVFVVQIQNPTNAALGANVRAEVVLLNDDENTALTIPTSGYTSPDSYSGYNLLWSDEFNDGALNSNNWTNELGGSGWGNNELQFYRNENTIFREGNLIIEAREESFGGRRYTSSRLYTKNKFSFKYGRVDIRAALPQGQGIWPALWMLGANFPEVNWPACGEIDIMEMIGGNNREREIHGTIHWQHDGSHANYGGSTRVTGESPQEAYHVYSIIWNEREINWLIDNQQYHTVSITDAQLSEFQEPFFLIMNVAVGGNWPGNPNQDTAFPQRMIVDYVRVFQQQ